MEELTGTEKITIDVDDKSQIVSEHLSHFQAKLKEKKQGFGQKPLKLDNIGNVPGLIDTWRNDLEIRLEEIELWQSKHFLVKQLLLLFKKKHSPGLFAQDLLALHPTKKSKDLVKILKSDPQDIETRIELVSHVLRSGREFSVDQLRILLLQSLLCSTYGRFSSLVLQKTLNIQHVYFQKVISRCKTEIKSVQRKLNSPGSATGTAKNVYQLNRKQLEEYIQGMEINVQLLTSYQQHSQQILRSIPLKHHFVTESQILDFVLEQDSESRNEKKQNLVKSAVHVLQLLRGIQILEKETLKFIDILKKIEPDTPAIYHIEAKILTSHIFSRITQIQNGIENKETIEEIKALFRQVHSLYGQAIKKIGFKPADKTEEAVIISYASFIHYFCQAIRYYLRMTVPHEWLCSLLEKTISRLQVLQETKATVTLISDLERCLHQKTEGD